MLGGSGSTSGGGSTTNELTLSLWMLGWGDTETTTCCVFVEEEMQILWKRERAIEENDDAGRKEVKGEVSERE